MAVTEGQTHRTTEQNSEQKQIHTDVSKGLLTKVQKPFRRKGVCLTNGAGATGHSEEENEPGHKSHTYNKINSKWITDFNVKLQLLGQNIGENIQGWELGKEFRLATESLIHNKEKNQ